MQGGSLKILIIFALVALSAQKPKTTASNRDGETESSDYQNDADYDFEYGPKTKLDETEAEKPSTAHRRIPTTTPTTNTSTKKSSSILKQIIQKSVDIVCKSDSYLFKINFDIESIQTGLTDGELNLNEKDLKNAECKTTNSSISIQFNTNWPLKLNFTLEKNSELISEYFHREFKLNQIEYRLASGDIRKFNNQSLSKIVKGHADKIECSNSKLINVNSNVILNIENYKIDIFAKCIKTENKWSLMYRLTHQTSNFFLILTGTCLSIILLFAFVGYYLNKNVPSYRVNTYDKLEH